MEPSTIQAWETYWASIDLISKIVEITIEVTNRLRNQEIAGRFCAVASTAV